MGDALCWRCLVRGCVIGLVLAVLLELGYTVLGANFREAVPGLIYRSSRLAPQRLETMVKQHGIRTVINLCGCCDPVPWYREQARTLAEHDVSMEDLGCSANRLPSTCTIRELVKILDHTEYPILVHCHRGIDRTGLVVVVAMLLQSDIGLDKALAQLSWRYAHLSVGKTGNMDRFFDLYREWLTATGQQHSRPVFRHWLEFAYCPGEGMASYEVLDNPSPVVKLARHRPAAVGVRCRNTSVKPWQFKPGNTAGIHMQYFLRDSNGKWVFRSRAGLFRALVPAGESIDLTLALPGLAPGRYELHADLIDEQHASFFQVGSEPLYREIVVE